MFLVDTSVWIDHLPFHVAKLAAALEESRVMIHPFVAGEIACGNLANRTEVLTLLRNLREAPTATHAEALAFIERHELMGKGIGNIDVHPLASVALAGTACLWTRDRRLAETAAELGLGVQQAPDQRGRTGLV